MYPIQLQIQSFQSCENTFRTFNHLEYEESFNVLTPTYEFRQMNLLQNYISYMYVREFW